MSAINDPLVQTDSPARRDHYSRFKVVLKSGDGRKDGRTDNTCENSDHYQP